MYGSFTYNLVEKWSLSRESISTYSLHSGCISDLIGNISKPAIFGIPAPKQNPSNKFQTILDEPILGTPPFPLKETNNTTHRFFQKKNTTEMSFHPGLTPRGFPEDFAVKQPLTFY